MPLASRIVRFVLPVAVAMALFQVAAVHAGSGSFATRTIRAAFDESGGDPAGYRNNDRRVDALAGNGNLFVHFQGFDGARPQDEDFTIAS